MPRDDIFSPCYWSIPDGHSRLCLLLQCALAQPEPLQKGVGLGEVVDQHDLVLLEKDDAQMKASVRRGDLLARCNGRKYQL
jgi:hypothetical protein